MPKYFKQLDTEFLQIEELFQKYILSEVENRTATGLYGRRVINEEVCQVSATFEGDILTITAVSRDNVFDKQTSFKFRNYANLLISKFKSEVRALFVEQLKLTNKKWKGIKVT